MAHHKNPILITLAGDLGSGKSSLARALCDHYIAEYYSTGAAQRKIAEEMGVTTLELNHLADQDPSIDDKIDSVFKDLNRAEKNMVVDSRMAFHFMPQSFKIRLTVNPYIAAERILKDTKRKGEKYKDVEEAVAEIEKRKTSERNRFLSYYKVDIYKDSHYDLVLDTSGKTPEQVFEQVVSAAHDFYNRKDKPVLGRLGHLLGRLGHLFGRRAA